MHQIVCMGLENAQTADRAVMQRNLTSRPRTGRVRADHSDPRRSAHEADSRSGEETVWKGGLRRERSANEFPKSTMLSICFTQLAKIGHQPLNRSDIQPSFTELKDKHTISNSSTQRGDVALYWAGEG